MAKEKSVKEFLDNRRKEAFESKIKYSIITIILFSITFSIILIPTMVLEFDFGTIGILLWGTLVIISTFITLKMLEKLFMWVNRGAVIPSKRKVNQIMTNNEKNKKQKTSTN